MTLSKIAPATHSPRIIYMYDRANWDALREELHILLTTDYTEPHEGMEVKLRNLGPCVLHLHQA